MENKFDLIIVGAGLSGLGTAHFIKESRPDLRVLVLEKTEQPGGAIRSFHQEGFRAEWGPHGFLNNCPESQELLQGLDLQKEVQLAPLGQLPDFSAGTAGWLNCRSTQKFLGSPILSIPAKLRLLADLFIKPRQEDQTVGQWAGRRFGSAVLPLVDAAITGTFAGDYERLSIDAVMPGLRELEKKHGSVLKGLKNKKKSGKPQGGGLPAMQNFPGGMIRLIEALAADQEIRFQTAVEKITAQEGSGWSVRAAGTDYQTGRLILALPVNQALALIDPLAPPPVPAIPTARLLNVLMGFGPEAKLPKAFGYLAPECEHRFCLGAMFSSAMFPDRAPDGATLIEVLVGGRRHPERLELTDAEVIDQAYADLRDLLDLPPKPPWFVKVLRPASGIPQLEMDHPALLQWRHALTDRHHNLHIIGFGWDGIGMNEMITAARKVARTITENAPPPREETKVKPVYF